MFETTYTQFVCTAADAAVQMTIKAIDKAFFMFPSCHAASMPRIVPSLLNTIATPGLPAPDALLLVCAGMIVYE